MSHNNRFEDLNYLKNSAETQAANPMHDNLALLEKAFHQGGIQTEKHYSAAEACIRPALAAIEWDGKERHILEAMPHFDKVENIEDLRAILARLNIETKEIKTNLVSLDNNNLPCLFSVAGEDVMVIASRNEDNTLTVFEGSTGESKTIAATSLSGKAYSLVHISMSELKNDIARHGWMRFALHKFKPALIMIFGISLLTNLAGLILPLFVMHVYDMGISTKSKDVVMYLCIGAGIVILTDLALRLVRTQTMAYFAARFDSILGMTTFQQLLYMPLSMTEGSLIGTQLNRLRQFEGVREAFTSSLAIAIVDIPFIFLFMVAIGLIASKLVWIPLGLVVIFGLITLMSANRINTLNSKMGEARVRTTNFAMELIGKRKDYTDINATDMALERYRDLSDKQSSTSLNASQFNGFLRNFTSTLTNMAGLTTLAVGASLAMDNLITVGALIASMALVWRVISPLQQAFLSFSKIQNTIESLKQINRMMSIKTERDPGELPTFNRVFKGNISISRAMYRYAARPEPTVKGVSLNIKKGQIVAITGPSGSGKSTVLKMIAGLYQPQSGAILADGIDLRQIDPAEWRNSIGYVPDINTFFYGTIEQNIKLGFPQATDEDMKDALRDANVLEYVNSMAQGTQTRLTGGLIKTLPEALKQRLNLARAYVRKAPVYILDNPSNGLDERSLKGLCDKIDSFRGNTTFVYSTQNMALIQKADQVVYMVNGAVAVEGTPQEVLSKINKSQAA